MDQLNPGAQQPLHPVAEFHFNLLRLTPRVFVTWALLAANVLVFVAMVVSGVSVMQPSLDALIRWGANFGPMTAGDGEWWRLITCTFLHIGLIHIAFNMIVLRSVGPFVERLLGNAAFLLVYLICGVAGSMASLAWNPYVVSAGASGAIFGLYGALLGFICIRRDSIPPPVLNSLAKTALLFIGYNAVYGVLRAGTDLAAHGGGLVAGFLCGLVMSSPLSGIEAGRRTSRAAILAGAAAVLFAAAAAKMPRPFDLQPMLEKLGTVEKSALAAYNNDVNHAKGDKLSDDQFADLVQQNVLGPWTAECDAIAKLPVNRLPNAQRQMITRLSQYMEARRQGWSMLVQGLRAHDAAMVKQANAKQDEAEQLASKIAKP